MKRWIDLKILGRGLAMLGLCCVGIAVWLAIAGPPAPLPETASISVPVQAEAGQPASAEPPPATSDDTKLQPPPASQNAPAHPAPVNPAPAAPTPAAAPVAATRIVDANDKRPRIAIIVTELGLNKQSADAATAKLPSEVSLAFLPFGDVAPMIAAARAAGHEILLDLPMEPSTYPDDNPGTDALMTNVGDVENRHRLDAMLAKEGPKDGDIVGVVAYMGSRFVNAEMRLKPIIDVLHTHGLLFVDNKANPLSTVPDLARQAKMPFAVADLEIDSEASRDAIDQTLARLEAIAKEKGSAVGLAEGYPLTLDRLGAWVQGLPAKGIVLAPISAVVTRP